MTLRQLFARRVSRPVARPAARLVVEMLEAREVPAVVLRTAPDTDAPNTVPLFLPLTPTNTPAAAVSYTATSSNPAVKTEVIAGGTTLKLDVSGTDSTGTPFTGTITLKLFTDVAPQATATLIQLANTGFFDGKLFHRVLDGFVAQGGSPNGDGLGGSTLPDVADEFSRDFTFASPGIVAMANARDDNNNSQFFITDIDTPLTERPQFLNFNHSIVGLLTSGFDTFQKIMTTPVTTANGENSRPVNPVTITKATVIQDTTNAVLKVTPNAGTSGRVQLNVTGTDGTGQDGTAAFNVNYLPVNVDRSGTPVNGRAFLNPPPAEVTVVRGGSTSITLTGTDVEGDTLTFAAGTPGNLASQPANATVSIDQATGRLTITPVANFTGDIPILVGVRDQTNRGSGPDDAANFDTQTITVRVRESAAVTGTITAARALVGVNQANLLTAAFTSTGGTPTGSAQFFADGAQIGTAQLVDGVARFSATFSSTGDRAVFARFVPADAVFNPDDTDPITITVSADAPAARNIAASGVEPGNAPVVRVTDDTGTQLFTIQAFDNSFTGGVRTAVADVTGDGNPDVVVVPRFGGGPLIRIFSGTDGALIKELMVFEETFGGGLHLDVADAYGRGYSQILVGAGFTGGPRVTLYDASQDKVLLNFFADDPSFRGGVAVDFSDLKGNGRQYIVTGLGKGGGPVVSVYDALRTDGFPVPDKNGAFLAGDEANRDGIRVGAGGLIDGTHRNILVGPAEPESAPLDQSFDPEAMGVNFGSGSGGGTGS